MQPGLGLCHRRRHNCHYDSCKPVLVSLVLCGVSVAVYRHIPSSLLLLLHIYKPVIFTCESSERFVAISECKTSGSSMY